MLFRSVLLGSDRSKNFRKLVKDTIAKPLFDRGLQAEYAPGSPFKTLNALIALQENVITPKTLFSCNQGHYYARGAFMKCHCPIGTSNNLLRGIYNSCNSYFAKTYVNILESDSTAAAGLDRWRDYLKRFGLGDYLGYNLQIGRASCRERV